MSTILQSCGASGERGASHASLSDQDVRHERPDCSYFDSHLSSKWLIYTSRQNSSVMQFNSLTWPTDTILGEGALDYWSVLFHMQCFPQDSCVQSSCKRTPLLQGLQNARVTSGWLMDDWLLGCACRKDAIWLPGASRNDGMTCCSSSIHKYINDQGRVS